MFFAVQNKLCSHGVVPIENSTAGIIALNHDLLYKMDIKVIGETNLKVDHALMTLQDTDVNSIKYVRSHP